MKNADVNIDLIDETMDWVGNATESEMDEMVDFFNEIAISYLFEDWEA